jgi:hypothetical protein
MCRRDALAEMDVLNNGIYSNTSLAHCGSNRPMYWLKITHDYLFNEFTCPTQVYIERVQVVHQRKDPVTFAETNRIMLPPKIITVFCENYNGQITKLCGQNAGFLSINVRGTRSNHRGVSC